MSMFHKVSKSFQFGAHQVTLTTGEIARQATGACVCQMGDTVVLATVVAKKETKPGQDFFPLTVDYIEKTYAAGKIEPLEQVVDGLVREVKTRHIARLQAGVCTIEYGFVLDDLLTNYERIADHCSNIAVAMIEVAADKFDTHEYLANVKHGGSVKFERRYEKYRGRYTFPPEAYSESAENQAEG